MAAGLFGNRGHQNGAAKTILLTSGSGLLALDLARSFHAAGHRVVVVDNSPFALCRFSTAVARFVTVPAPALQPEAWGAALLEVAADVSADVIVPVFEEALYLAEILARSPNTPRLFAPHFSTLVKLHNKWTFQQCAQSLGLRVPQTELATSREQLLQGFDKNANRVFKSAYSRWALQTIVKPRDVAEFDGIDPSPLQPWVVQEYLPGQHYATYSLAHQGRLTAHLTYPCDLTTGHGPTHGYRPIKHAAALEWVQALVSGTNYTGQIGLDLIEDETGEIAAIECNPRPTCAQFLLTPDGRFPNAVLDPNSDLLEPASARPCINRLGMLGCLRRRGTAFPGWRIWTETFLRGRQIRCFQLADPVPALMLPVMLASLVRQSIREQIPLKSLVTRDRVWDADRPASPHGMEGPHFETDVRQPSESRGLQTGN